MSRFKRTFQILLATIALTQLAACSKTVQWEEEVPLNTGETIWVKRTDSYVKGGEPGNPLKMTWGLDKRAYEFSWHGKSYSYQAQPKVFHGALLIYIFPSQNAIAFVDSVKDCVKPGYGEFLWRDGRWQLQQEVNKALVGQRRNLMGYFSEDGDIPLRVDREFKQKSDTAPNRAKKTQSLEESDVAINCSASK